MSFTLTTGQPSSGMTLEVSPPAQKPGSELGGSLPGLVGNPIQARSLVTLKDGRTLKVQRVSKHGVLTLVHTCGGFAAYSHASAVVAL